MTTLDGSDIPFFFNCFNRTCSGADFINFIEVAVAQGVVVPGDYVLFDDSADNYFTAETEPRLLQLQETAGVRPLFSSPLHCSYVFPDSFHHPS
jgi:hypothetical protein